MRPLVFAVSSVALGASAHVLGGGAPGAPALLLLLVVALAAGAGACQGAEIRTTALLAVTLGTQVLVHATLMSAAMAAETAAGTAAAMPGGMPGAMPGMQRWGESRSMMAAHLLAAGLLALLLRYAEAGAWALRRLLSLLVPELAIVAQAAPMLRPARPTVAGRALRGLAIAQTQRLRGPPLP